jgi:hypothetical protein
LSTLALSYTYGRSVPLPHKKKNGTLNGGDIPYASDHKHESNNLADGHKASQEDDKNVNKVHLHASFALYNDAFPLSGLNVAGQFAHHDRRRKASAAAR